MKNRLIAFFISSILLQSVFAQTDSCINFTRLGISFPALTNQEQMDFSQYHLDFLSVNMFRFAENWALRETTQGVYNWGPLDARMNWIEANNYDVLLTIQSNGPDWACDSEFQNDLSCAFSDSVAFRKYIDTLLVRYGENIKKIQFGNEWHSTYWYAGYAADFIRANNTVWEAVQEKSPDTQFVLGGFASGTMTNLAACYGYLDSVRMPDSETWYQQDIILAHCNSPEIQAVAAKQDSILSLCKYDIIDMHLYDDVENWPLYYHIMDSITEGAYPIIVTEMGGPNLFNELPYSDEFQAQRLYQYIKCVDSLMIPEVYYYKMVSGGESAPYHQESGLIDGETLLEKPAYYLFKTMNCDCGTSNCPDYTTNIYTVFPNPARDIINLSELVEDFEIQIYSISGQLVFSGKNVNQIPVSNYKTGVYFVKVKSGLHIQVNKLFITK
ncbi:MAG: T9SS type A sorting domain-containing protein [Bacteroidales bacterium]|nr:T9SS type A sorting domain-containing protein [Bacteroidales bacterium]